MNNKPAKQLALFFLITLGVLGVFLTYQQWQEEEEIETFQEAINQHSELELESIDLSELSPNQVVQRFYSWYLNYKGNPVADKAYLSSELVSDRFKELIQTQVVDQEVAQVDPFLLAQDLPEKFEATESIIEDDTASIKVIFTIDQQEFFRQVDLIKADNIWQINQVQIIEGVMRATDEENEMEVIVYFSDKQAIQEGGDCGIVYGTSRTISQSFDLESEIEATLQELFKGPTTQEEEGRFTSIFSQETADLLNDFRLVDNTAYVDLDNAPEKLAGQNASCAGQALLSQIEETVKHNQQVTQVVISTNGDAQAFYEWLQLPCDESNNFCQTVFEE
jgi:hypothetical protein